MNKTETTPRKLTNDPELIALERIGKLLAPLDPQAMGRVLNFLIAKYGPRREPDKEAT